MIDTAIADSTCLIVLDRIGRLDILLKAFSHVVVSPAVVSEVGWVPTRIEVFTVGHQGLLDLLRLSLGEGESEVITLATMHPSSITILDDLKARHITQRLSLRVMGTIGLVARAKRSGLIPEAAPILASLKNAGFHMSDEILRRALYLAGEG